MITESDFKGDWHLVLGLIFGATTAYNLMRLVATRTPRNAVNVGLYAVLTLYEIDQAKQHWATAMKGPVP